MQISIKFSFIYNDYIIYTLTKFWSEQVKT